MEMIWRTSVGARPYYLLFLSLLLILVLVLLLLLLLLLLLILLLQPLPLLLLLLLLLLLPLPFVPSSYPFISTNMGSWRTPLNSNRDCFSVYPQFTAASCCIQRGPRSSKLMCTLRGKSKGGGAAWNISVARGPPLRGWVCFSKSSGLWTKIGASSDWCCMVSWGGSMPLASYICFTSIFIISLFSNPGMLACLNRCRPVPTIQIWSLDPYGLAGRGMMTQTHWKAFVRDSKRRHG